MIERGGGRVGQLVVDDDGNAARRGDLEDSAERRIARVAVDVPASHLAQVNLAERACRRFRELAVEPRGRGAVGGVGERERGEDAVRVLARGGGDPRRVVFLHAADAEQQHLADVVPLHRLHVGVDRFGVRQVGVRVDQRPRVLGPRNRCSPDEREGEERRDGDHERAWADEGAAWRAR